MSRRLLLCLLTGLLVALGLGSCTLPPAAPRDQLVILISIDGFRWDYLQKYDAFLKNKLK